MSLRLITLINIKFFNPFPGQNSTGTSGQFPTGTNNLNVKDWLAKHPRFHMHFTPTSASWVNLVERFFRDITEEQIRRGVFRSVDELKAAIMQYLEHRNANPKPYQWTAKPEAILAKVTKAKETLGTLH